jgi:ATP-dependent Zn protease
MKYLTIALLTLLLFSGCERESSTIELSYEDFLLQVESDQVLSVKFSSDNYTLKGKTVNGESFETVRPPFLQDDLSKILLDHRVAIIAEKPEETSLTIDLKIFGLTVTAIIGFILLWLIPLILTVVVVFFVWRFLKKNVKD